MPTSLLAGLSLLWLLPLSAQTQVAAVWSDPSLQTEHHPSGLLDWVHRFKYADEAVSTADLLDSEILDPKRVHLLIIPYGPAYPVAGRKVLDDYLRGGGSYLAIGGPSFTRPLVEVDGKFVPWDEFGETVARLQPTGETTHGPDDAMALTGDGPWQLAVDDLQGWAYANVSLAGLTDADAGLTFEAKGDATTPLLALEIVEDDGSRWKQVIELTDDWQSFALHLSGFASYASPERNGPDDGLRPSHATRLSLGFTRGMVGNGPHQVSLRNPAVRRAAVPAGRLKAADLPDAVNSLARHYFSTDADGFARAVWPTCFGTVAKADGGWQVTGPTPQAGHAGLFPYHGDPDWRLLRPNDDPAVGIVTHHAGPYLGSDWAAIGRERWTAADRAIAPDMLRELSLAPSASPLRMAPADDGDEMVATVTVTHRGWPGTLKDTVRLKDVAGHEVASQPVELAYREPQTLTFALPATPLQTPVDLQVASDELPMLDAPRASLDVTASLRALADWFVATGADDAKFSGISFIDNRGARTLLGAWRIFGEQQYLDAAIAWGRAMVAEQRPDGGYRMGYGIGRKGEACYVADGGEIAVGIACLAVATDGELSDTFRKSLDSYMGYRESFRVPSGGIGVGWCLHDYGQRPVVPLDEPTRIFAPERNTYTISCTLAAAYAHAHLHGDDPALVARCEADADWFIARSKSLYGAGCESFLFAHALSQTAERRQLYRQFLHEQALVPMSEGGKEWWLLAGGRAAFNVEGLDYWLDRIGPDPMAKRLRRRAAWAIYGDQSPTWIHRLIGRTDLTTEQWIYLCYSGVGLADLVKPSVTMVGFER